MLITLHFLTLAGYLLAACGMGLLFWSAIHILGEFFWTLIGFQMPTYVAFKDRCSLAWANGVFTVKRGFLVGTAYVAGKAYASARLVKLMGQWVYYALLMSLGLSCATLGVLLTPLIVLCKFAVDSFRVGHERTKESLGPHHDAFLQASPFTY